MSMFSIHYLIANQDKPAKYWTGTGEDNPLFWGDYTKAVRFHSRASAEQVVNGILCFVKNCKILEDE